MRLLRSRWRRRKTADLRMLGLARRAGRVEIGEEAVGTAARAGKAALLLLASDASENTKKRAESFAFAAGAPLAHLDCGKTELGRALGLDGPAMAAVTDPGLAAAVAAKLAAEDPERYGPVLETLRASQPAREKVRGRRDKKRQG